MSGRDPQAGVGKGTVNPKARLALLTHSILFHSPLPPSPCTLQPHIKIRASQPQQARGKDWGNTVKVILTSLCHL